MKATHPRDPHQGPAGFPRHAGVTLIEVLVAIFVTGVGLLALLTLFPLGALTMAQAVKDDRTAAVAARAVVMSQAGTDLLSQTGAFVVVSLSAGKADPQTAAELREEYEDLDVLAADLEVRLVELGPVIQDPVWRLKLQVLQAQIKAIRTGTGKMIGVFRLLAGPNAPQ